MQILIVDDIEEAADSLAEFLDVRGHRVRVAYDGFTALAAAADVPPDAAIVDLGLPALNGFEVAERMRRAYGATMRLIAYTGWPDRTTRQRALASGFDTVIAKPAPFEMLRQGVAWPIRSDVLSAVEPTTPRRRVWRRALSEQRRAC